jgi:2-desacetyl-2-hydroxyethyl bacteriochlorophyllide A dehydrogenase
MTTSIPKTGQRIVVTPDNRVEVREFSISPPGPGAVLIQTACTLISAGTELGNQEQRRDRDYTPGYSNAGRIIAVGEGVQDYRAGDRVLSLGEHATHVISSVVPHRLRPVPDGVSDEEAAFGVLGSVAMHGVRKARIELGEYALITGMGLVGQLALRLAAGTGAEALIAADLVDERLKKAKEGGATLTFNPKKVDLRVEVERATGGRWLDVTVEASGYPDILPAIFDLSRIGGRVVLLGSIWRRKVEIDFMDFHLKELLLVGCHQPKCPIHPTGLFPWTQQYNRGQILTMIADGRLDVKGLISHRLPGAEAGEAYRLLRDERGRALGVILTW